MYSVVLMMALSGGAEATEFGHRGGCNGCNGSSCSGAVASCHGAVASCSGCNGGGHGCHGGGLFSRKRHGHGGCNGCNGSSCSCSGGGFLSGLFSRHRHGCNGCHGNGHGCHGSTSCTGHNGHGCTGGTVTPVTPEPSKKMPEPAKKVQGATPATIVVTLPANARLTVDGNTTTSTSERRVLVTPALEQGEYTYTLQAQIERDGQTVAETQVITVRPGQTTAVPFNFSSQSVASR